MEQHKIRYGILLYLIFLTGWYLNSYGVLIPYYSEASGNDETFYSFLFVVRSIAYTLGSIAVKYVSHRFNTHAIFMLFTSVITVTLFLCSLSINSLNLTVMLFTSGFCIMSSNVLSFSLSVKLFFGSQP
jgi:MFS family permease